MSFPSVAPSGQSLSVWRGTCLLFQARPPRSADSSESKALTTIAASGLTHLWSDLASRFVLLSWHRLTVRQMPWNVFFFFQLTCSGSDSWLNPLLGSPPFFFFSSGSGLFRGICPAAHEMPGAFWYLLKSSQAVQWTGLYFLSRTRPCPASVCVHATPQRTEIRKIKSASHLAVGSVRRMGNVGLFLVCQMVHRFGPD